MVTVVLVDVLGDLHLLVDALYLAIDCGEQLLITVEYQEDVNVRGAAEVFTYMAPIRDAILYGFDTLTVEEWADVTAVLT